MQITQLCVSIICIDQYVRPYQLITIYESKWEMANLVVGVS